MVSRTPRIHYCKYVFYFLSKIKADVVKNASFWHHLALLPRVSHRSIGLAPGVLSWLKKVATNHNSLEYQYGIINTICTQGL